MHAEEVNRSSAEPGALLAPARRTVAAALRVLGLARCKQFHRYHRVLSQARWSSLASSRILVRLLVAAFAADGPLAFGVDDTLGHGGGRPSDPLDATRRRTAVRIGERAVEVASATAVWYTTLGSRPCRRLGEPRIADTRPVGSRVEFVPVSLPWGSPQVGWEVQPP
jgi:hypothetical protein